MRPGPARLSSAPPGSARGRAHEKPQGRAYVPVSIVAHSCRLCNRRSCNPDVWTVPRHTTRGARRATRDAGRAAHDAHRGARRRGPGKGQKKKTPPCRLTGNISYPCALQVGAFPGVLRVRAGGTAYALRPESRLPFIWCWNRSYQHHIAHGRVLGSSLLRHSNNTTEQRRFQGSCGPPAGSILSPLTTSM